MNPARGSRTISWTVPSPDLDEHRTLSGLELLRRELQEGAEPSPICVLMGIRPVQFEHGLAVFEGIPGEYHYNSVGRVQGGFAATILDCALGCSVHTTLEPGFGSTTVELKVNYVRPLSAATGRVISTGRIINVGSRIASAEARLTDTNGKLYGHATTTCLIFPIPG